MIAVCTMSYVFLWFFLKFTHSKLSQSRLFFAVICTIALVDAALFLTNPLHNLMFLKYTAPRSTPGPLFWVHAGLGYLAVLMGYVSIFRYTFKMARKNPYLILIAIISPLPFIQSLFFALGIFKTQFDYSMFGFFFVVAVIGVLSYRTSLFGLNTTAFNNIFAFLSDVVIVVDGNRTIMDINLSFSQNFPGLAVETGKTTLLDFSSYIKKQAKNIEPENLFSDYDLLDSEYAGGEFSMENSQGELKTFTVSFRMIAASGRFSGYIISMAEVSAYREMISEINDKNSKLVELKELAESASQAKTTFLANMSHEMRTPMNAIIGMTNIAKASDNPERKNECIGKIEDASIHLLGVINDVLDMAKIEANKFDLSMDEFNFEKTIRNVSGFISYSVSQKEQEFTVFIDDRIPQTLIGDRQRLSQAITNLLSNAVKFTPVRGTIALRAYKTDEADGFCTIKIEVEDSGTGISQEQQKRLFTPFEQVDSDASRRFGGTGLGLVISRKIINMMGGEISVKSALGEGSLFSFTARLQIGAADYQQKTSSSAVWDDLQVMVADNSPDVNRLFERVSKTYRFACDIAHSGKETSALLKNSDKKYHIFFIDFRLPDMSGLELTRQIRQNNSDAKIILLSSAEWSNIEEEAKQAGVNGHISKPLFPSMIVDSINNILGGKDAGGKAQEPSIRENCFAGRRILLAEDIEVNREIVITLMEPTGIIFDCAENGKEAFEMFIDAPDIYDAILMDIQMPQVNGYEAARMIRELGTAQAKNIPIIAMTANVFQEDIDKCLACGMNDHIAKPIDIDEVADKLSKYFCKTES